MGDLERDQNDESRYDDVGEPINNTNYLRYNNDDDADSIPDVETDIVPSLDADDADGQDDVLGNYDTEEAIEDLRDRCNEMGVVCTVAMENQVKSIIHKEQVNSSHLTWYVRGIIMANQTQLLPSIQEATTALNQEVRSNQKTTSEIKRMVDKLMKTSESFKTAMESSTESVKDGFDNVLKTIAEKVAVPNPKMLIKEMKNIASEEFPAEPDIKIEPTSDELVHGSEASASTSVADRKKLDEGKVRFLLSLGIKKQFVDEVGDDLDLLLSDQDYADFRSYKMSATAKREIKDVIMGEFQAKIESLEQMVG